jgi:hypothetical protein
MTLARRQRHRGESAGDVLDRRLAAIDEQLRERLTADDAPALEVGGNVHADRHFAGAQLPAQILGRRSVVAHFHSARRLHVRHQRP